MKSIRRSLTALGLIGLIAFAFTGCDLLGNTTDRIVGGWQLVSVNGVGPVFVTDIQFTDNSYVGSTAGIETHVGTWTKSAETYTLTGTIFGFAESSSFTPEFSNSNNTLSYSNTSGDIYIYNRQ